MDLIADRGRRVSVDELNTTQLLAHARKEANRRNLDDVLIVDVDAHHYENEHMAEIVPFMENDVLRQLSHDRPWRPARHILLPAGDRLSGHGRPRHALSAALIGKDRAHKVRDVQLGAPLDGRHERRLLLSVPDRHAVDRLASAEGNGSSNCAGPTTAGSPKRCCRNPTTAFSRCSACRSRTRTAALRTVEKFGDCKGVTGFMVTTVRTLPVHDNSLMKVYRAIEERGLSLAFHSGVNWGENVFKGCNRFISVHALGFTFYNILHCTNWVINGMGERFPKLPVIWVEAGLAWVPFLMQRLDHEYMLRTSECPLLKKKPSDYMRDMYYSTQPMEVQDMGALETTFRMINAETQLMYSSDYPHWDFDLPQ